MEAHSTFARAPLTNLEGFYRADQSSQGADLSMTLAIMSHCCRLKSDSMSRILRSTVGVAPAATA